MNLNLSPVINEETHSRAGIYVPHGRQIQYSNELYFQLIDLIKTVWTTVSEDGASVQSFLPILQDPQECFIEFVFQL